jgi:DNA polymerase IIIc chi subunit
LLAVLFTSLFVPHLISTPVEAKGNTVEVKCRNIAVALATLDIAISLSDNESLDASLKEGEIARDLQSERQLLVDLRQGVKKSCPDSFSDILEGLTFNASEANP